MREPQPVILEGLDANPWATAAAMTALGLGFALIHGYVWGLGFHASGRRKR